MPAGSLIACAEPTGSIVYTRDPLHRVATRQVAGQNAGHIHVRSGTAICSGAAMPNAGITLRTTLQETFPLSASPAPTVWQDEHDLRSSRVACYLLPTCQRRGYSRTRNLMSYDPGRIPQECKQTSISPVSSSTQASNSTVDKANEFLTNGATNYTYDANGNRLTETRSNRTADLMQSG